MSRYILFLAKLKEKGRPFLKCAKSQATLWDYPQGYLVVIRDEKVSPFVKFEIILPPPPPLCFSLDPLTNNHCRTWSSVINLWMGSGTYQKVKNPAVSKAKVYQLLRAFKRKCFGGIWCCHIDNALLESSSWYGFIIFLN